MAHGLREFPRTVSERKSTHVFSPGSTFAQPTFKRLNNSLPELYSSLAIYLNFDVKNKI